jgi:Flp pilus assembly protein TadG
MKRWRHERGTAAVEMVLVLPALLLLIAATVGAGRVVSTKSAVLDVAREAARAAADAPDAASAEAVASQRAREVALGLGLDVSRLEITQDPGAFGRGAAYGVRVDYRVQLSDLPTLGFLPGSVVVSARHTELIERFGSR